MTFKRVILILWSLIFLPLGVWPQSYSQSDSNTTNPPTISVPASSSPDPQSPQSTTPSTSTSPSTSEQNIDPNYPNEKQNTNFDFGVLEGKKR